jgi:hypothetical protein
LQLNLFFHALAMLCSLGSVVFAAGAGWRGYVALVIGCSAAVVGTSLGRLPDPVWVGGATAAVAVVALVRPRQELVLAAAAGVLAGLWLSMLRAAGLPWAAAAPVAVVPLVVSAVCSRRNPRFAPPMVREEALLVVVVLAVVVAVAPAVAAGWQSATALNLQQKEVPSQAVPAWTLFLTLGSAVIGGLYAVWMRR